MAEQMNDSCNDQELFRRMTGGDEGAFLTLYRRRQTGLHRFVTRMCGRPEIAEEVVQEVFLCLLRGRTKYDPRLGALSTYLYGMARNLVLKHLERGSRYRPLHDDFDLPEESSKSPAALLEDHLELESLRRAILSLPAAYREVLVLCDLEEMSYTEAAVVLECPVGSVRSRLHRARGLLESKLRGGARDEERTATVPETAASQDPEALRMPREAFARGAGPLWMNRKGMP